MAKKLFMSQGMAFYSLAGGGEESKKIFPFDIVHYYQQLEWTLIEIRD